RIAGRRTVSQNNLKQIGLAMHNYHDTYRHFPPQALTDKNGKPLLSWRVAVLPFIEQDNLYRQFKLDEPWDSEHNRKLLERMPKLGGEFPDVINAAFCDGSVHTIEKKKIDDKVLRWLILRNSGQNKSLP